MRTSYPESEPERAAVAHAGGHVVASPKRCSVCGEVLTGLKTSACSDKCRAAKSRRNRTDELATLEEQLYRGLVRVQTLRRRCDDRRERHV
jgi:predicted nucleic acid-binding Zn ribbon protein